MPELSKRLKALVSLAEKGNIAADIGCDHGYVSIWLVQNGIFSKVIAMDVKSGPLEAAAKNIGIYGVQNRVELRQSDGLAGISQGEVDSIFCAGMGGALICRILSNDLEKAKTMSQIILQPQSEVYLVRRFLREHDFIITGEDMVREDGKYYPMFRAVNKEKYRSVFPSRHSEAYKSAFPNGFHGRNDRKDVECQSAGMADSFKESEDQDTYDYYGMHLLIEKHPVLHEWLLHEQKVMQDICKGLEKEIGGGEEGGGRSSDDPLLQRQKGRLNELREKQKRIETALAYY